MTTDKTSAQRLVERVESDSSHLVDPLVVAAEAAKQVLDKGEVLDTKALLQALNEYLPPSAAVLERGLALGMVVGVQAAESGK